MALPSHRRRHRPGSDGYGRRNTRARRLWHTSAHRTGCRPAQGAARPGTSPPRQDPSRDRPEPHRASRGGAGTRSVACCWRSVCGVPRLSGNRPPGGGVASREPAGVSTGSGITTQAPLPTLPSMPRAACWWRSHSTSRRRIRRLGPGETGGRSRSWKTSLPEASEAWARGGQRTCATARRCESRRRRHAVVLVHAAAVPGRRWTGTAAFPMPQRVGTGGPDLEASTQSPCRPVWRCTAGQVGCGRPGHHPSQVAVYTLGFTAYLGRDVTAFGDEAAEDGGFLEHGAVFFLRVAGRGSGGDV
ncbi:hypothetical protein S1361_01475 [Streptomyces cyanogenus]|uniref:Uncharacterized protein n=1 Tax=Streptomyces cyanogenus TaxID=80860 RepID=A0ABX7THV6_STRCY|nr:hypothetical protein S1361_01475 [Streptomyces cyanogenus]